MALFYPPYFSNLRPIFLGHLLEVYLVIGDLKNILGKFGSIFLVSHVAIIVDHASNIRMIKIYLILCGEVLPLSAEIFGSF